MTNRRAGKAGMAGVFALAMMLCGGRLLAQTGTAPAHQPYTLAYDSVSTFLMSVIPPKNRGDVKSIKLSAQGTELRVDAEVRMSAVPGFEFMGALGSGYANVTGVGPVNVISPGLVGWQIRTISVAGAPIAQSIWAPLIRNATKRQDTYVPFRVGTWVKGVAVEEKGLRLY